jgi:hypothetical protein
MFPEGTRLRPETLESVIPSPRGRLLIAQSHGYAKKMDLPVYNNVLIPRTKGFVACVTQFRESHIKYVYGNPVSGGIVNSKM